MKLRVFLVNVGVTRPRGVLDVLSEERLGGDINPACSVLPAIDFFMPRGGQAQLITKIYDQSLKTFYVGQMRLGILLETLLNGHLDTVFFLFRRKNYYSCHYA